MKVIKWILIILVALIAGFLFYSSSLPNRIIVSESILIDASKGEIYDALIDYENWDQWASWNQIDTNMKSEYTGVKGTVGYKSQWWSNHESIGNGTQEIIEIIPNEYIKTVMTFGEWSEENFSEFILSENEGMIEIEWTFEGAKTPFYLNIMNVTIEPVLVENYQKSLSQLKEYVENKKRALTEFENIEVTEIESQKIIFIKDSTSADGISSKLAELYTELSIYLGVSGIEASGMPLAMYHFYSQEKVILSAAMPIEAEIIENDRIKVGETPAGKAIKGIHYGDYNASGMMHENIEIFAQERKLSMYDLCWEIYANDPTLVDSAEVKTVIYYPIN